MSAGHGLYRAAGVGEAAYAQPSQPRRAASRWSSELMRGINLILRVVTWIIIPTTLLLVYSQLRASPSIADAARGSVAGVITLIPEGIGIVALAYLALESGDRVAALLAGRHQILEHFGPAGARPTAGH